MCTVCLDPEPEPATAVDAAVPVPEASASTSYTPDELLDELHRWNAEKAKPNPICRKCGMFYARGDAAWVLKKTCATCEINLFEELLLDYASARGRKARQKALKAIKRFRRKARK